MSDTMTVSVRQAVLRVTNEIISILKQEEAEIMNASGLHFSALLERKVHMLSELNKLKSHLSEWVADSELAEVMRELQSSLDRNIKMTARHMNAIELVTEVVTSAIAQHESDGLYTGRVAQGRKMK